MKILIIGGVAGGASAATRARRTNPNAEICIFEKGPNVSFANCGLPYHIGGEIQKREKLLVAKKDLFEKRFGIQIYEKHLVTKILPNEKLIEVIDLHTHTTHAHRYDTLIISTGSKLRTLPLFSNTTYENVHSLWSLDDLDKIISYRDNNPIQNATIIGAGFVGLEVAEQLAHKGIKVTVVEKAPQVLGPLDPEMARLIEDELFTSGVEVRLGREIKSTIHDKNKIKAYTLDSNETIETDLIIWGIGVTPENTLAQNAGLAIGATGGIVTNEFQQTSIPDIYAVGDASEYHHGILDKKVLMPLAGPANRSGRIAGEHAATGKSQFTQHVVGTAIVRVFKKTAASTGLSEKSCIQQNIPYVTSYISAYNHAGYYPGAEELIIKLICHTGTRKILGAQVVGGQGADKRIDIISTLIHFGGTAKDLALLDLAYAPPFGSAKDPLHIAAYSILNHFDRSPLLMHPSHTLEDVQLIDVRTEKEIAEIPLPGARHIPIDTSPSELREKISDLKKERPIVVTCHSGKRAHILASMLSRMGFKEVYNLSGGMRMRSLFR